MAPQHHARGSKEAHSNGQVHLVDQLDHSVFSDPFSFNLGCSEANLPINIAVVKANEVEEILAGNDEKYKALVVSSETTLNKT